MRGPTRAPPGWSFGAMPSGAQSGTIGGGSLTFCARPWPARPPKRLPCWHAMHDLELRKSKTVSREAAKARRKNGNDFWLQDLEFLVRLRPLAILELENPRWSVDGMEETQGRIHGTEPTPCTIVAVSFAPSRLRARSAF